MREPLESAPPPGPEPASKRRRILEAARSVFAEQGFDAARVDQVARRARVSKGTVYNHFESKESLLVESVLDSMAEARTRVAKLGATHTGADRELAEVLRALIVDILPSVGGERQSLAYQIWALVARDPEVRERVFSEFRGFYQGRESQLATPLARGSASGAFRSDLASDDLALLLLSIFDGLVYRTMFDRERVDPERVLDGLLRLLESGLRRDGPALAASPADGKTSP